MRRALVTIGIISAFALGFITAQTLPYAWGDTHAESATDTAKRTTTTPDARALEGAYFDLSVFADALQLIRTEHLHPPSVSSLTTHAIEGMTQALDPFSTYLSPRRLKILKEDTEGAYKGIGAVLTSTGAGLSITRVLPDSPAQRQGLQPGDMLLAIDGMAVGGQTMEDVRQALRGEAAGTLTLRVRRNGHVLDIDIQRARIHVDTVTATTLSSGMLWLQLRQFDAGAHTAVKKVLQKHLRLHPDTGVILDLRDDPGGLFTEAIDTARLFLNHGTIVQADDGWQGGQRTWHAKPKQQIYAGPLVVLINRRSASSAEIVAGALQENGRARVVGEPSFGKVSIQRLFPLANHGALKLTVTAYYTPKGHCIAGTGILPDLRATPADASRPHLVAPHTDMCLGHPRAERAAPVRAPAQRARDPQTQDDLALQLATDLLYVDSRTNEH